MDFNLRGARKPEFHPGTLEPLGVIRCHDRTSTLEPCMLLGAGSEFLYSCTRTHKLLMSTFKVGCGSIQGGLRSRCVPDSSLPSSSASEQRTLTSASAGVSRELQRCHGKRWSLAMSMMSMRLAFATSSRHHSAKKQTTVFIWLGRIGGVVGWGSLSLVCRRPSITKDTKTWLTVLGLNVNAMLGLPGGVI